MDPVKVRTCLNGLTNAQRLESSDPRRWDLLAKALSKYGVVYVITEPQRNLLSKWLEQACFRHDDGDSKKNDHKKVAKKEAGEPDDVKPVVRGLSRPRPMVVRLASKRLINKVMSQEDSDSDSDAGHHSEDDANTAPVVVSRRKKRRLETTLFDGSQVATRYKTPSKNQRQKILWAQRTRFKALIRRVCSLTMEDVSVDNYNVLGGFHWKDYGLSTAWPFELMAVLRLSPNFTFKEDKDFLFKMLQHAVQTSSPRVQFASEKKGGFPHFLHRLNEAMASPDLRPQSWKKRDFCESKIFCELRKQGYGAFDPWSSAEAEVKTNLQVLSLLPEEKWKRSYNKQNLISWLKTSAGKTVKAQRWSQYLSHHQTRPSARKEDLRHKMNNDPAVAMVGFKQTPQQALRVRILLEDASTEGFDTSAFSTNLEHIFKSMCGFSHEEMYSDITLRKNQLVKYKNLKRAVCKGEKQCTSDTEKKQARTLDSQAELGAIQDKSPVMQLKKLPPKLSGSHIVFDPGLESMEGLAVLCGTSESDLAIRGFLDKDLMSAAATGKGGKVVSRSLVMKSIFTAASYFLHVKNTSEIQLKLPGFQDEMMRVMTIKYRYDFLTAIPAETQTLICPSCGHTITAHKDSTEYKTFTKHLVDCKYIVNNCECDISFKTTREKMLHNKLHHSNKQYSKCPHCPQIFQKATNLEEHIAYHHGTGEASRCACDLCLQTFRCANHLRIHRFKHECYYCVQCNQEITSRHHWNKHLKALHDVGFTCHQCSKHVMTEKELHVHIKKKHVDPFFLEN